MPGHWRLQRISRIIARKHVVFPRARAKSQRFMISPGVLFGSYERFPARPKTDGGGPYRPFDIATRAIQLMCLGTEEDHIELPAFEYPHVPGPVVWCICGRSRGLPLSIG